MRVSGIAAGSPQRKAVSSGGMSLPAIPYDLAPVVAVTLAAAFMAGLARGFSGFGAAMVFVPAASAVLGPVVAMPVLLIADVLTSSPLIARAFRECSWPDVRRVAVGALLGLPVGSQILTASDPILVRWTVTVLIFLSLLLMASGWRFRGRQTASVGAGVGAVSGLMSGLAQIGGPPVVMYWSSGGGDTARMRANLIAYFAVLMWLALAIFAVKGLLPAKVLWLAAATAPGYALGMYVGARMFPLASAETFRQIAMGLVAVAAIFGAPVLDPFVRGLIR